MKESLPIFGFIITSAGLYFSLRRSMKDDMRSMKDDMREIRSDMREIRSDMKIFQQEVKDFHGRLCKIEERRK